MRREGLDGKEMNWEELMGKRLFKGVWLERDELRRGERNILGRLDRKGINWVGFGRLEIQIGMGLGKKILI